MGVLLVLLGTSVQSTRRCCRGGLTYGKLPLRHYQPRSFMSPYCFSVCVCGGGGDNSLHKKKIKKNANRTVGPTEDGWIN